MLRIFFLILHTRVHIHKHIYVYTVFLWSWKKWYGNTTGGISISLSEKCLRADFWSEWGPEPRPGQGHSSPLRPGSGGSSSSGSFIQQLCQHQVTSSRPKDFLTHIYLPHTLHKSRTHTHTQSVGKQQQIKSVQRVGSKTRILFARRVSVMRSTVRWDCGALWRWFQHVFTDVGPVTKGQRTSSFLISLTFTAHLFFFNFRGKVPSSNAPHLNSSSCFWEPSRSSRYRSREMDSVRKFKLWV